MSFEFVTNRRQIQDLVITTGLRALLPVKRKGVKCLQLKVEIEDDVQEPLVTIHCKEKNAFIEQLIAAIQMVDQKLLCFCCCFIISTILSIRKEAADNHKLEKGLQKLKEEQKHGND